MKAPSNIKKKATFKQKKKKEKLVNCIVQSIVKRMLFNMNIIYHIYKWCTF